MDNCIFCKIIKGDIPSEKVYEDDDYLAFNDVSPQAPSHILVIPKKHISMISKMGQGDSEIVGGLFRIARKICMEKSLPDYRLVVNNGERAGQTVFHIHLHILGGRTMNWPPG